MAQNNYAVRWFKGKELNMVFGLQLSFARVGSTVNFIVMEPLYNWIATMYAGHHRTGIVLFIGNTTIIIVIFTYLIVFCKNIIFIYIASLTCVFSLICALILAWMDKRAEKKLDENQSNGENEEPVKLTDIKDFTCSFWLVTVICVAYYVAIFPFIALGKYVYF